MTVGLDVWPLLVIMRCRGGNLIVDDLDDAIIDQSLQWLVVDIGVGDVTLLVGAEMEHLAAGQRYPDGGVGSVANGLHRITSCPYGSAAEGPR